MEYSKVAIFRDQIVCSSCKGTVYKLIVIRVSCDNAHSEMWINQLYILLIQYQHNHIFSYGRRDLLFKNLLILVQNIIRGTEYKTTVKESIPYRAVRTLASNDLQ